MTFDEFQSEYDDRVQDVQNSSYTQYTTRLRDWLDFLDTAGLSSFIVAALEARGGFSDLYEAASKEAEETGSGELNWTRDKVQRLGQYLGACRLMAKEDLGFVEFASTFLHSGAQFSDAVYKVNGDIFEPLSRDLLKYIKRELEGRVPDPVEPDRIVILDHSSAAYRDLMEKLAEVQRMVLKRSPTLPHWKPEFSTSNGLDGLVASGRFSSVIGAWFPMAPCGLISL